MNNNQKPLASAPFELIVEFFDDQSLEHLANNLPRLQKNNIHWILLPPQQLYSKKHHEWFDRYAPCSYTLSDQGRKYLTSLCKEAKKFDINIILDMVFNHADPDIYQQEMQKNPHSFYKQNPTDKGVKNWLYDVFPLWNTQEPLIQQRALDAIHELRAIGIKGFRFDSADRIEHEFYNYILKNAPSDELHIFEVRFFGPFDQVNKNFDQTRAFMEQRIAFRPMHTTLFYDFQQAYTMYHVVKNHGYMNKINNIYSDIIFPGYGVTVGTTHDDIAHNYQGINQDDIYIAQLMNFWASPHTYGITTLCNESPIANCFTWNWESLEKFLVPLIQQKNSLGALGAKPVTVKPILVHNNLFITLNRYPTASMVFNATNTEETIYDKLSSTCQESLSLHDLGLPSKPDSNITALWNNQLLTDSSTDPNLSSAKLTDKLYVPQRNFEIFVANQKEDKPGIFPIHIFWYQGKTQLSERTQLALSYWQEFVDQQNNAKKSQYQLELKLWCRNDIHALDLEPAEVSLLERIEKDFPIPDRYAGFSDIARLIILKREGGLYVDTDTNPRFNTPTLLSWAQNGSAMIVGLEPNGMINNAVIGCPITTESKNNISKLLQHITANYKQIGPRDIIELTGPGAFTRALASLDKNYYFVIPAHLMFLTWQDRLPGKNFFCTNQTTLVDHCYHGTWVSDFSKKNSAHFNGYSYGYRYNTNSYTTQYQVQQEPTKTTTFDYNLAKPALMALLVALCLFTLFIRVYKNKSK